MNKLLKLVCLVGLSACAQPGMYVTDIRAIPGGIEVTKCQFDTHGKATTDACAKDDVMIAAPQAEPPPPTAPTAPTPNAE
jgi:hypothetical protein